MCEALRELFADELEEREVVGIQKGIEQGIVESILELLNEIGDIPTHLKETIFNQSNSAILKSWLKIAARANSIEGFTNEIQKSPQ